jgi:hypothetical protein
MAEALKRPREVEEWIGSAIAGMRSREKTRGKFGGSWLLDPEAVPLDSASWRRAKFMRIRSLEEGSREWREEILSFASEEAKELAGSLSAARKECGEAAWGGGVFSAVLGIVAAAGAADVASGAAFAAPLISEAVSQIWLVGPAIYGAFEAVGLTGPAGDVLLVAGIALVSAGEALLAYASLRQGGEFGEKLKAHYARIRDALVAPPEREPREPTCAELWGLDGLPRKLD